MLTSPMARPRFAENQFAMAVAGTTPAKHAWDTLRAMTYAK